MLNLNILFNSDFHVFYYSVVVLHLLARPQQVATSSQGKVFKSADIMIGGLFPVHKSAMDDDSCTPIFKEGVVLTEAMVYAVKYVNENNLLPYNITLGYDIRDTCSKVLTALKTSLDFVNGRRILSEQNSNSTTVNLTPAASSKNPIAVLGAGNSVISSAVNNILSIFRVPQIGYASTSRILSNKNRYPTFLRMVPPDSHQGRAIAKIVSHFGWNYVALLASDDIYGRPLAETFKNEAKKFGVCLAIDILIPYNPTVETIRKTVGKLRQNKNIEVILLFTSESEAVDILYQSARQKVTRKVWIGSDSWADSPKIAEDNAKIVDGMFRIINQPTVVPDFMEYFYKLNPLSGNQNSWFGEFWEKIFQCTISKKNLTSKSNGYRFSPRNCTGEEQLAAKLLKTDAIFSRVSYVLDAVLSVVYSVRKICQSDIVTKTSGGTSRKEACINRVTPSSVLSFIFNITFTSVTNRTVSFDKNGNILGRYDIINLQSHGKDKLNTSFLKVGEYDGKTGTLKLDSHAIHWPGGVPSPPNGRCSSECRPGTFKVVKNPICCWTCKPCPSGSISNTSGASACTQCHADKTPNDNKTKCIFIPTRFLRWDSAWAWVLSGTVILCELACFFTVGIFLRHKETPIVKAANREISFLLLFGLMMGFLIPLANIGKPTNSGCKMQIILFGTSFAFSLSIVLARINRTIVIFRYSKVSPKNQSKLLQKYLSMFLYNRTQIMLALFFTVIELLLCFAWLLSSPPRVTARRLTMKESLLLCDMKTSVGQIISNAFLVLLSLLCTFVAFKSRKLPQNYNEAKFISFAMFVFNFIWLTFVGAFYGTPDGQHNVIINCFAILASNFAILALIFGPKLYIILFRPGLNQMAVFRALTARYTFKSSRRSSAITSDMMGSSCILKENKCVQTCGTLIEEHVDERTSNGPVTITNDAQACKETILNREIRKEGTEKRADKLMRSKWGRVRELNTKAVSDSALNKLADNVKAAGSTDTKRIRRTSTSEEASQSLIAKENVDQEKTESLCRNSSFNQLKYPLIAIGESKDAPISILSLKRKRPPTQGTEQDNFVYKGRLESEV